MDFLFKLMLTLALVGVVALMVAAGLELALKQGAAEVVGYTGLGLVASAATLGISITLKEVWAL